MGKKECTRKQSGRISRRTLWRTTTLGSLQRLPMFTPALGSGLCLALEMLADIQKKTGGRDPSPYQAALIYAALGENDQAFRRLGEAHRKHDGLMTHLKVDPRLDPLRSDPRFQDLVHRMGLTQ